jgi:hypothetical protein
MMIQTKIMGGFIFFLAGNFFSSPISFFYSQL